MPTWWLTTSSLAGYIHLACWSISKKWCNYHWLLSSQWVLLPLLGAFASFCPIHWPIESNSSVSFMSRKHEKEGEKIILPGKVGLRGWFLLTRKILTKLVRLLNTYQILCESINFPKRFQSGKIRTKPRNYNADWSNLLSNFKIHDQLLKGLWINQKCSVITIWTRRSFRRVECSHRLNSVTFSCTYLPICNQ